MRLNSASASLKADSAVATRVSASISSVGVGSGTMLNSASPARTPSPTSLKQVLTIPEIFDLTWNSTRGLIWPIATAFSVIDPRVTPTSVISFAADFPLRTQA